MHIDICLHQFHRYTLNALRSIEFEVCTESAMSSHHGQGTKDCLAPNSDQKNWT